MTASVRNRYRKTLDGTASPAYILREPCSEKGCIPTGFWGPYPLFMAGDAPEDAYRTRYFDWCSAKIAAHFLSLSPEEVWQRAMLAREAPDPVGVSDEERGFFVAATPFELIRLLSLQLAAEMQLPPFDEWMEEYRRDPERFEREIVAVSDAPATSEPDSLHPSG